MRDQYLAKYPQWLKTDSDNELVVFDQMVCMWSGRYTGKLKQKPEGLNLPGAVESTTAETGNSHETTEESALASETSALDLAVDSDQRQT